MSVQSLLELFGVVPVALFDELGAASLPALELRLEELELVLKGVALSSELRCCLPQRAHLGLRCAQLCASNGPHYTSSIVTAAELIQEAKQGVRYR